MHLFAKDEMAIGGCNELQTCTAENRCSCSCSWRAFQLQLSAVCCSSLNCRVPLLCFALLGTFERRSGMQVRMHLLICSQKKAEIRKRSQRNERPKMVLGGCQHLSFGGVEWRWMICNLIWTYYVVCWSFEKGQLTTNRGSKSTCLVTFSAQPQKSQFWNKKSNVTCV